jgi:hypothetical protein
MYGYLVCMVLTVPDLQVPTVVIHLLNCTTLDKYRSLVIWMLFKSLCVLSVTFFIEVHLLYIVCYILKCATTLSFNMQTYLILPFA